jgi:hypothetical protein
MKISSCMKNPHGTPFFLGMYEVVIQSCSAIFLMKLVKELIVINHTPSH